MPAKNQVELTEEGKRYLPEIRAYIQAHNKKALTGYQQKRLLRLKNFLIILACRKEENE